MWWNNTACKIYNKIATSIFCFQKNKCHRSQGNTDSSVNYMAKAVKRRKRSEFYIFKKWPAATSTPMMQGNLKFELTLKVNPSVPFVFYVGESDSSSIDQHYYLSSELTFAYTDVFQVVHISHCNHRCLGHACHPTWTAIINAKELRNSLADLSTLGVFFVPYMFILIWCRVLF